MVMFQTPLDFSKQLLKGRIAETIFEQMFRDVGTFTVLAFGYENILPELAHRQNDIQAEETMEIIRRAPDFAVIDNKSHDVYLIEVKYMMHPNQDFILKAAQRMTDSWKPSYLFLATPKGFFFGRAGEVVKNKGVINELANSCVSSKLQEKYLELLNQFIFDNPQNKKI
jgi:hypothetical protein